MRKGSYRREIRGTGNKTRVIRISVIQVLLSRWMMRPNTVEKYTKKDVFEMVIMARSKTDYEVLKTLTRKASEKINNFLNSSVFKDVHIRVLLPDIAWSGMFLSLLLVFLKQSTINSQPTNWYESRMILFVNALHFSTAFGMITFRVYDIWHRRGIQLCCLKK